MASDDEDGDDDDEDDGKGRYPMLLVDNELLLSTAAEEDDDDALPLMVTTLDLTLTMTMNSIPIVDGRCGGWNEILHTVAQSDAIQLRSSRSRCRNSISEQGIKSSFRFRFPPLAIFCHCPSSREIIPLLQDIHIRQTAFLSN